MTYRGFLRLLIFAVTVLGIERCLTSRFWTQCKECTWFRENISSREIKEEMDKRQTMCDLNQNIYDSGICRDFADDDFVNEFMAKIRQERRIKKGKEVRKIRQKKSLLRALPKKAQGGSPKP